MQHKPVATYGMTKAQYAQKLAEWEAAQSFQPGEGFFARFKKKRG